MALTEKVEIDSIEVVRDFFVQVRQATIVERNGEFVSNTFNRWVLHPDDDISNQEQKVQAICNAAWTLEVKAAYSAFKAAQAERFSQ
jgi:hypothetical protein